MLHTYFSYLVCSRTQTLWLWQNNQDLSSLDNSAGEEGGGRRKLHPPLLRVAQKQAREVSSSPSPIGPPVSNRVWLGCLVNGHSGQMQSEVGAPQARGRHFLLPCGPHCQRSALGLEPLSMSSLHGYSMEEAPSWMRGTGAMQEEEWGNSFCPFSHTPPPPLIAPVNGPPGHMLSEAEEEAEGGSSSSSLLCNLHPHQRCSAWSFSEWVAVQPRIALPY